MSMLQNIICDESAVIPRFLAKVLPHGRCRGSFRFCMERMVFVCVRGGLKSEVSCVLEATVVTHYYPPPHCLPSQESVRSPPNSTPYTITQIGGTVSGPGVDTDDDGVDEDEDSKHIGSILSSG
jgi:hypothetical protein